MKFTGFDIKLNLSTHFLANGVKNKLKVKVSEEPVTEKPKLSKMKHFGTRTTKDVDPEDIIKIKPKKSVPGRAVVVYKPVKKGVLSLSDVKVYVKPIKTTEEPEEPEGPEEEEETPEPTETAGPGEPKGPGGPEGPDGPDGPEDATNPEQPAVGPGTNPGAGNDGDPDTCFKSDKTNKPWWSVDLGKRWEVTAVHIKACAESCK